MQRTSYKTFAGETRVKIKRKGSRFIAVGTAVESVDELEAKEDELWEEFPKASHIASGSVIVESGRAVERYENDGEPRGTAGEPILQVVKGEGLSNAVVFVVRYFGGTELGTGGLSRAYSDAAREAIKEGKIVVQKEKERYRVRFPYSLTGEVVDLLAKYEEIDVLDRSYGEQPELELSLPVDLFDSFSRSLRSGTAGEVTLEKVDTEPTETQ